jgi:large subunit ribosomal protein L24
MSKSHVKKGDEVVVIAGTEKGKRGRVIEVQKAEQRVIVEGAKMIKRHLKKGRSGGNQGSIMEREGTLHLSNVMRADVYDARAAKRNPATPEAPTTPAAPEATA